MAIVGRYRRKAQAGEHFDLSHEPPLVRYGLRGTALVALAYILTFIISPAAISWSLFELPTLVRFAGVVMALTVLPVLLAWTQVNLGKNVSTTVITREDHELVTTGPYRWVPHPLYLVGMMLYTSLALISGSWVLFLALCCGLVFLLMRMPTEEAMLEDRFGDTYRDYRRRTGRFFHAFVEVGKFDSLEAWKPAGRLLSL